MRICLPLTGVLGLSLPAPVSAAPPQLLDDRYELTLFAEHPEVRTPTGCALDHRGRLLVVESHTHFRPKDYDGPESDRILAMEDTDGDGKADKIETFYEGGTHTMSIAAAVPEAKLFVATRSEIFSLPIGGDPAGRTSLIKLETPGKYPHNGLCGLTLSGDGRLLYFGLGENLGEPYKLVSQARPDSALEGGGEGGNIYSFEISSGVITRLATGFWNPFGICLDAKGRMFTVDNDPDSSPPNRLLHVVAGGDYGYQFRYGRSGKHPLQAWDGELPGTLPMVSGTGEAACAVMPVGGELWVTSWGHNRIERYTLKPRGLSFGASMKTLVRGDEMFRPVDFAHAPDGSIYFTDWVDKSYKLHSKGRVWKLTPKKEGSVPGPVKSRRMMYDPASPHPPTAAIQALADGDPFAVPYPTWVFAQTGGAALGTLDKERVATRVALVSSIRWNKWDGWEANLKNSLAAASPQVRLAGVRVVADDGLEAYTDRLAEMIPDALDHPRLFDALVAALKHLGADIARYDRDRILLALVDDASKTAEQRARALAKIPPDSKKLSIATFEKLIASNAPALREAAVWHLAHRSKKDAAPLLQKLMGDPETDPEIRLDITAVITDRGAGPAGHPRRSLEDWVIELRGAEGDPRAGRRVFFSDKLGMCARCHTHGGYGNAVGPDLSGIGASGELETLLTSILHPNKELAPRYVAEVVETADGNLQVGIPTLVTGRGGTGTETFVGIDGKPFEVELAEIKSRAPWVASLMPEGLDTRLSIEQMRDLIAFLQKG